MNLVTWLFVLLAPTLSSSLSDAGEDNVFKHDDQGQDIAEGQVKGQTQGRERGQRKFPKPSYTKPPPKLGVAGDSRGRPCGFKIGAPQDGPGAERRNQKALASMDDLPRVCDDTSQITLELESFDGSGRKLTTSVSVLDQLYTLAPGEAFKDSLEYWVGTAEDGSGTFNFVRDRRGYVHGNFRSSDGTHYEIRPDLDGNEIVTITHPADFPKLLEPISLPTNRALAELNKEGTSGLRGIQPNPTNSDSTKVQPDPSKRSRKLGDDLGGNVDIMIIWTPVAECLYSKLASSCTPTTATFDSIQALVELAIAETNFAYLQSGITTRLNLVHWDRTSGYTDPESVSLSLDHLSDRTNGLQYVTQLRTDKGADLVCIVTADPGSGGIADLGANDNAASSNSAVSYKAMNLGFVFAHEIGHNFGCNHDRGTEDECSVNLDKFNFGYRDPQSRFRTIMGYNCDGSTLASFGGTDSFCDLTGVTKGPKCPVIQMFSNPVQTYQTLPVGNAQANCARRINEYAETVAGFETHQGVDYTICFVGSKLFELELRTDRYPNEVLWEVTKDGSVLMSGGPYDYYSEQDNTFTFESCLEDVPMNFTIYDLYQDGICCSHGSGHYTIKWDREVVHSQTGNYGYSDSTSFGGCTETPVFDASGCADLPGLALNLNSTRTCAVIKAEGGSNWCTLSFSSDGNPANAATYCDNGIRKEIPEWSDGCCGCPGAGTCTPTTPPPDVDGCTDYPNFSANFRGHNCAEMQADPIFGGGDPCGFTFSDNGGFYCHTDGSFLAITNWKEACCICGGGNQPSGAAFVGGCAAPLPPATESGCIDYPGLALNINGLNCAELEATYAPNYPNWCTASFQQDFEAPDNSATWCNTNTGLVEEITSWQQGCCACGGGGFVPS